MSEKLYGVDMDSRSLYHHGIKGQKWGVRRFQNENGSLTAAGKERYSKKLLSNLPSVATKDMQREAYNVYKNRQKSLDEIWAEYEKADMDDELSSDELDKLYKKTLKKQYAYIDGSLEKMFASSTDKIDLAKKILSLRKEENKIYRKYLSDNSEYAKEHVNRELESFKNKVKNSKAYQDDIEEYILYGGTEEDYYKEHSWHVLSDWPKSEDYKKAELLYKKEASKIIEETNKCYEDLTKLAFGKTNDDLQSYSKNFVNALYYDKYFNDKYVKE